MSWPDRGGVSLSKVSSLLLGGNRAVVIGDSLATQDYRITSGAFYTQSGNGIFSQINARMRQYFQLLNVGGHSGQTLATVLSYFETEVTPFAPDYLFVIGSIENDIAQLTPAASIINSVKALIVRCQALGIRLVITGTAPGGSLLSNSAKSQAYIDLNRTLEDLMRMQKNTLFLRADYQYYDASNLTVPSPLTGGYSDGTWHPYARGASVLADSWTTSIINFVGEAYDPFDAGWFTGATGLSALVANPFNQGSQAALGGLTGFVPASGVTYSNGGTGVGVASVVARTDRPGQWCRVAYTGPAAPVFNTDRLRATTNAVSLATAGLAVGDYLTGLWEIATDGPVIGLMGAQVFVNFIGSTNPTLSRSYGNYQNAGTAPNTPMLTTPISQMVLGTPNVAIPVGTTSVQLFCEFHPSGANAAFNALYGRHGYKKLSSQWY